MDGFDDLLAPSRNVLEENPFADPFAKRSNSPDPWATPFANNSTDEFSESATSVDSHVSVSRHDESSSSSISQNTLLQAHELRDPAEVGEDHQRDDVLHTSGFKESIEPTFSETITTKPSEHEDPGLPHVEPASSETLEEIHIDPPSPISILQQSQNVSHLDSHITLTSTSESPSELVSHSENTSLPDITHSITGLSLGGESLGGGWRVEQSVWSGQVDDDSDDDKPIGQTMKSHDSSNNKLPDAPAHTKNDSDIQPVFVISVDDPQKVGDPIRSFTMYTVHTRATQTTSPLFQRSAFSVLRRYSDFLWLYETLSLNNPGVVVPPVPEKNPFGRFDDHFVRQRRFALEKCIQKIANHPVLGKDTDLKMFLESDSFALDIKHRKAEIAHERGGIMASIGQAVTGPRFHETDEWFDRQKAYLDSLESQLRGLVKAIESVARQRSELATATGEFAQTVSDLSSSDLGKQLSYSLAGLAEVGKKAQDVQTSQSEQDMVTLMGTVDEYARLINSVRLAFNSRIRAYNAWRTADGDLLRTKQLHERNRAQGRIPTERLGYSLSQIAEAERRAMEAKHEFDHVSKLIKSEVARFEQERVEDFKNSLHAFLEGMISKQKELIGEWENYQQMLLKRVGAGGSLS